MIRQNKTSSSVKIQSSPLYRINYDSKWFLTVLGSNNVVNTNTRFYILESMNLPRNINQSIQYQEGSVVSKEIVNRATGTITLFAFDKGQGLSEHKAPYDAIVMIIDGVAEITVSGKISTVKVGEYLIMPANAPHALKAKEQFKMILTMIKS